MYVSGESLLVVLLVGLIAGWLAGQIVRGTGFGIIGDILIGIIGAFIGSWLLPQLGLHLGAGMISAIINATIGALLLLLVVRLVRGGGGRSSWEATGEEEVGEAIGEDAGNRSLPNVTRLSTFSNRGRISVVATSFGESGGSC